MPQRLPWKRVEVVVVLGADAADDAAVARGRGTAARRRARRTRSARAIRNSRRSSRSGGTQTAGARVQPVRELDELPAVPPRRDGTDRPRSREAAPYMPTAIDVFAKVRGHERAEQLRAAREADLLPYFRRLEGPAGPVVEMEGAERIMLGSNNYLGLTADPRVHAGRPRRARALRDRPDRLAAAQRHARPAPRARGRAGRVDGHRGGDRLHHRPPGQRRHARHDPRRPATR